MDIRARAQGLIDQLAVAIGIEGLAFDEDGMIDLELDDGRRLAIGLDPQAGALTLLAHVADGIGARADAALWRRLLEANDAWARRDGPWAALQPGSGNLVLEQALAVEGLTASRLEAALTELIAEQERLATLLGSGEEVPVTSDQATGA